MCTYTPTYAACAMDAHRPSYKLMCSILTNFIDIWKKIYYYLLTIVTKKSIPEQHHMHTTHTFKYPKIVIDFLRHRIMNLMSLSGNSVEYILIVVRFFQRFNPWARTWYRSPTSYIRLCTRMR